MRLLKKITEIWNKKIKYISETANDIKIISNGYYKAILSVFNKKDKNDTYVGLNPVNNADENGTYSESLRFALENEDIKNIAVAGIYCAGKSSFIKSFFSKPENVKYNPIFISLMPLIEKCEQLGNAEVNNLIEKSILQQLFYREKSKKIPLSRYNRLTQKSKWVNCIYTIAVCCTTYVIFKLVNPKLINEYYDTYKHLCEDNKGFTICSLVAMIMILFLINKCIFLIRNKISINKFRVQDAELEFNEKNESIFNRQLDEIIYFFQCSRHRVVIIEDLDRFENHALEVFYKLKELNFLINTSSNIGYEVDFIYAVSDDMFLDSEKRTKFFDYIVPIIPEASYVNSNEIIWKRLQDLKLKRSVNFYLDKNFINKISVYIGNQRLINNIINEFMIYQKKINLDDKKMFSIITYKNLFPDRYAQMQQREGTIVELFKAKEIKKGELSEEIERKKDELKREIANCRKEGLRSKEELLFILYNKCKDIDNDNNCDFYLNNKKVSKNEFCKIDKVEFEKENVEYRNNYYNHRYDDEIYCYFGSKKNFLDRLDAIDKIETSSIEELKTEIKNLDNKLKEIGPLNFKQLFEQYDLNSMFGKDNEIERFFISRGYIAEDYEDYITNFKEGDMTRSDFEFVSSVINHHKLPYDYKLNKIDKIVERFELNDYKNEEILNVDLLNHLIEIEDSYKIKQIIQVLNNQNNILEFCNIFIEEKKKNCKKFVNVVIENCSNLSRELLNGTSSEGDIDVWMYRFLKNEKAILQICNEFKVYISKHKDIQRLIKYDDIDVVINSVKSIEIKFEYMENVENRELGEAIYINNLYKINQTMLKYMFELYDVSIDNFEIKGLTEIYENEKLTILKDYVIDNFEEFYNSVYVDSKVHRNSENTILEIVNNDNIDEDIRKNIIEGEEFCKYNLQSIKNKSVEEFIIIQDKFDINYGNLLYLYNKEGIINDTIVKHMSNNIEKYKTMDIHEYKDEYSEEAINEFKKLYCINEKVAYSDFCIMIKVFNIKMLLKDISDDIKIKFLIEDNMVIFCKENFEFISKFDRNLLVQFIINNKEAYMIDVEEYCEYDILDSLLVSKQLNNEEKKTILKYYNINEFKGKTLWYILKNGIVQESDFEDIDNIYITILSEGNISFQDKIDFISLITKHGYIQRKRYLALLPELGEDFHNFERIEATTWVPNNKQNETLCKILESNRIISSFHANKSGDSIIVRNFKEVNDE